MTIEERKELLLAISFGWKSLSELRDSPEFKDESFLTELAALQNDLSLLPVTLQIENPPSQLKDKVARKLYRIKDEIRTKVKQATLNNSEIISEPTTDVQENILEDLPVIPDDKETSRIDFSVDEEPSRLIKMDEEFEEVESLENVSTKLENEIEKLVRKVKTESPKENSRVMIDEPGIDLNEDDKSIELNIAQRNKQDLPYKPESRRNTFEDYEPKKKSYLFQIISFVLFFIVAVGLVIMYFKFTSDVDNYQMQVDHLNQEITTLSAQFEGNSSLQAILDSRELRIINLQRTNKLDNGFAKVFLDLSEGRGVLQLSELPAIETGRAYHLWGNVGADYYSLSVFTSLQRMDFKNFTFSDFLIQPGSKFLLIEDPDDKTDAPGNKILFEGSIE
jgi:nitrate reductase NapE component